MRRGGLVFNVSIGMTACLMMLPGLSGAVGPGQVYGRIPNSTPGIDQWYKTDPQDSTRGMWALVYDFDDIDEDEWTTGFTILDLNYRDFTVLDPYVYFVNYMTIPWVAITWDDEERTIYPFADQNSSMNNQIRAAGSFEFLEGNEDEDPASSTSMDASYNLDCNGDSTLDFTFEIWYQLNADDNTGDGNIDMHIRVVNHPFWIDNNNIRHEYALDGDFVEYMEFPFLFNPDINGISDNDVQWWDDGDWPDVDEEGAFTTINGADCMKVIEGDRNITMKSVDCGQSNLVWYVIKYDADGQFSRFPSAYDNSEDIDNEDVEIWYIANFSRAAFLQQGFGLISANYYNLSSS